MQIYVKYMRNTEYLHNKDALYTTKSGNIKQFD